MHRRWAARADFGRAFRGAEVKSLSGGIEAAQNPTSVWEDREDRAIGSPLPRSAVSSRPSPPGGIGNGSGAAGIER